MRTAALLAALLGHGLLLGVLLQWAPKPAAGGLRAEAVLVTVFLPALPARGLLLPVPVPVPVPAVAVVRTPAALAVVARPLTAAPQRVNAVPTTAHIPLGSSGFAAAVNAAAPIAAAPLVVVPVATADVVSPALAQPAPAPATTPPPAAPETLLAAHADHRDCARAPHPAVLRERGIEGVVTLRVQVDAQGRAAQVRLLATSGWQLFDEAALRQARGCRFVPALRGGQAVESWVEFPVRFAIAG